MCDKGVSILPTHRDARFSTKKRVTESDYWPSLEYRLCREFAGLADRHLQYFWCDGFIPSEYRLESQRPVIIGRVWICNGPKQMEWEFTLLLPAQFTSLGQIDWASLLPAENMTRWLSIDLIGKRIAIEPAVAVRDREQNEQDARGRG